MFDFFNSLMENFKGAPALQKGFLVSLLGIAGVFFVLVLFYLLIKVLTTVFRPQETE